MWTDSATLTANFSDPKALHPGNNVDAELIVTDYLMALRKHSEYILRSQIPETKIREFLLQFIITVPAIWSDLAQAKTRLCAEKAGMGLGSALHVISEPEAAAIYTLGAMSPKIMEIGSTFVLVDAGGGTVDLIFYTITALKPVIQIVEAAPGCGALCGLSFINQIFRKFLQEKFEDEVNWDDSVLDEVCAQISLIFQC